MNVEDILRAILTATQSDRLEWKLTRFEREQPMCCGIIPSEMTFSASFRLLTEKTGTFSRQRNDKILITRSIDGKYYFSVRSSGMIVSYITEDDITNKDLLKNIYIAASKNTNEAVWYDLSQYITQLN